MSIVVFAGSINLRLRAPLSIVLHSFYGLGFLSFKNRRSTLPNLVVLLER